MGQSVSLYICLGLDILATSGISLARS